jgi:hypothetical protein
MIQFNLKSLRISKASNRTTLDIKQLPHHKPGEKFLKGPIPWNWLSKAAKQPGKALHVAIAIWLIAGIKNNRNIDLSYNVLEEMGVDRHATYLGLTALEEAGLISVIHNNGSCPAVTINEFEKL